MFYHNHNSICRYFYLHHLVQYPHYELGNIPDNHFPSNLQQNQNIRECDHCRCVDADYRYADDLNTKLKQYIFVAHNSFISSLLCDNIMGRCIDYLEMCRFPNWADLHKSHLAKISFVDLSLACDYQPTLTAQVLV